MNRQAKINIKWAGDDASRFLTIAHLKIFKVISQDKHQMSERRCLQISHNGSTCQNEPLIRKILYLIAHLTFSKAKVSIYISIKKG